MKPFYILTVLCLSLSACKTTSLDMASLTDFLEKPTQTQTETKTVKSSGDALSTEMQEIEMLTGRAPVLASRTSLPTPQAEAQEKDTNTPQQAQRMQTRPTAPILTEQKPGQEKETQTAGQESAPDPYPHLAVQRITLQKPLQIDRDDITWAATNSVSPPAKPAPENFAATREAEEMETQASIKSRRPKQAYEIDTTADMAIASQTIQTPTEAERSSPIESDPEPAREVEPIDVTKAAKINSQPMYTSDDFTAAANEKAKTESNDNSPAEVTGKTVNVASGCPPIRIVPESRSITYFDESLSGKMAARASIRDIRGGCETVEGGMEIDLDILMKGRITKKGRFEGNPNREAFITFPYFVSVFSPTGELLDKQILATAMRFEPIVNHLDHAEKITQFVPMDNMATAKHHVIAIGYQLTRKQLEYNRAQKMLRADNERASPDVSPAQKKSYNPLGE